MSWSLLLHILQVILGVAFIFHAGMLAERRHVWYSVGSFLFGVAVLAVEFMGFVTFIGPLLK